MCVSRWKLPLFLTAALISVALAQDPGGSQNQVSLTTREHLRREQWWPTKQFTDQSQFAGSRACAECHAKIVREQSDTQMALTMTPAADSRILATHTGNIFALGSYHYAVEKAPGGFKLKVSDGAAARTEPLDWAFGSGWLAQSYVWWQNGQLIESRFNYFSGLSAFGRTPARLRGNPISLDMAEGRPMADFEARNCLACHSTALTTAEPLTAIQFHPGVSCEACHGPGREHIAAIKSSISSKLNIVNPARLNPVKAVDFCGACHGTPKDVELGGTIGKLTVRFPAYRLEMSRCWGTGGDARLTCFACHDPHRPLVRDDAAYDVACLRCHANGAGANTDEHATHAACPVARSRCSSCHMQKIQVDDIHHLVTDHDIRIVKANAPFPD